MFFIGGGVFYSLFTSWQINLLSRFNNYTSNYAEQGGVYYCNNLVANVFFENDVFYGNKVVKMSGDSVLQDIFGAVFSFNGQLYFITITRNCIFDSNYAEYAGNIKKLVFFNRLIKGGILYSDVSCNFSDYSSIMISLFYYFSL